MYMLRGSLKPGHKRPAEDGRRDSMPGNLKVAGSMEFMDD